MYHFIEHLENPEKYGCKSFNKDSTNEYELKELYKAEHMPKKSKEDLVLELYAEIDNSKNIKLQKMILKINDSKK